MQAFDAAANGVQLAGTSLTYSHTCSGSQRKLYVGVSLDNDGTDKVSSVTYNGITMILTKKISANAETCYLFELNNPPTGANNIVITTSTTQDIRSCSSSYTGVAQTTSDNSTTNTGASVSTLLTTLTTYNDNCWMVSYCQNTAGVAPTGGANTTVRASSTSSAIGDSNGVITPPGNFSMTWNCSAGHGLNVVQASFAPFIIYAAWVMQPISQPYFPSLDLNQYIIKPTDPGTYFKTPPPPIAIASWIMNPISQPYFPPLPLNIFLLGPVNIGTYFKSLGWYKIRKKSDIWSKIIKPKITSDF